MTERFRYFGASALVHPWSTRLWAISNVYSQDPGKGEATKLMERICEWADDRGIELKLLVNAYGRPEGRLSNDQLEAWYSKFGFVRDVGSKRPYTMTRIALKTRGVIDPYQLGESS